ESGAGLGAGGRGGEGRRREMGAGGITSVFCAREPPARTERLRPRRVSTGPTWEVIQGGAIPKSIPAPAETASVKSRTGQEGDASTGTYFVGPPPFWNAR